ncbi:MAG TPA: TadE/TadG family type IV pilus assembly protein [Candidatus Limnocylindrales bacterium]|nr:TadE/TadG family type IV pilus assembly protein [Candidatus Limnocylindrales bacterium]
MTRRRGREGGQSLAEIALILPVFLLMLMAIFDFGRAIYAYNTLGNASRAAARLAIVNQDTTAIEARAKEQTIGMNPDEVTVDTSALLDNCTTSPPKIGCVVNVTVEYDWNPITPIIGNVVGPIALSSTTSMPIERVYP